MADLDRAIAAAREALARVEAAYRRGTYDDGYFIACDTATEKLEDLLAALDQALPAAAVPDREAVARGMYEAEMRRRGLETCWEAKSSVIKSGWYEVADDAIAAMQPTKGVE